MRNSTRAALLRCDVTGTTIDDAAGRSIKGDHFKPLFQGFDIDPRQF